MNVTATNTSEEEEEMCDIPEEELDMCHLQAFDTIEKQIRLGCEIIIVVWSLIYLVIAVRERSFLGGQIFKENMQLCPSRVLFLIACLLVVVCVPLRSTVGSRVHTPDFRDSHENPVIDGIIT